MLQDCTDTTTDTNRGSTIADATSIITLGKKAAKANAFLLLVVGIGSIPMLALVLFGYQLRDINIIMGGSLFLFSLVVVDMLTAGEYMQAPGSFPEMSFGYWLPVWIMSVIGGLGDLKLSFLAAPTASGGYLSALGSAPVGVQTYINRYAAPVYESMLKVAITFALWQLTFDFLNRYLPSPVAVIVALVPAAGLFAGLHGLRSTGFYIAAFLLALFMMGIVYLEDYMPGNQTWFIPASVALIFGIHRSINIQNGGGYFQFISDMLAAEPPMLWANEITLLIELVTFLAALWFAGKLVVGLGGWIADLV